MKLNKKIETEVLKIYDTWMHSYLYGDVETYDSFLDDDYHFIGSAKNEEFLNRKDTTKFFEDTGDQFAGKTEIRNETMTIEQFGELIFLTHIFDGWFLNENDWNFYARFRFTSILKNTKDGWRFIYQHFSIPDSKTEEGETIGYDKINDENQELREAIARRTFELEAKNRELEIEGALERIRAQAVAMKESSDLLDIVVTMRNEFINLGHEAHYFWHMMWLPEKYEKAMTSGDGTKIGFVMELPRHIHGDIPLLAKWEKSKKATVVYTMNAYEAIDYVDKMVNLGDFKSIDPQAPSHDDIRHIGGLTFIMARTTHGEIGYSLPGIVKNPPKEDIDILVQFAGAFDLAHRRFLDLQKAEKQAREVEIELALEKVRSRTMAMQHSDELQEASFLLDQQVRALGIKTWGCAFNIYGEKESTEWFGNEAGVLPTYTVPRKGIFKKYYQKGQNGESLFIQEFSGKACIDHYEYMSSLPVIGDVLKNLKKTNNGFPTYQIDHVVYFKYGYLLFITKEHVPDAHDIFKRFAKVFEQTYTRFLDLQKAEVQAREAQIETALERVRSRAMAMHKSEELADVAQVLFQQINLITESLDRFNIIMPLKDSDSVEAWVTDQRGHKVSTQFILSSKKSPVIREFNKAWKEKKPILNLHLKGKRLQNWLTYINEVIGIPLKNEKKLKNRHINLVYFTHGYIGTTTHTAINEETIELIQRFTKVFEQTYTRFLDLKKAEAQAREAQIEAALERVRAQSMAMHSSEELKDVIRAIFDQMGQININAEHAGIVVDYEPKKDWHFWVAETQDIPAKITIPYLDSIWDHQFTEAKQNNKTLFTTLLDFDEKNAFYKKLLPHIEGLTKEMKASYFKRDGLAISTALQKDIGLYIENFSGTPYSDEENSILLRFAKVFQQTYTRFLDLQKAEAQAREAQIVASLERVRAATMAMHQSKELSIVLSTLFGQYDILGINPSHAVLTLINKEKNTLTFRTTGKNGYQVYAEQEVDLNLYDSWIDTTEKWKKSNPNAVNVNEYPPEVLPDVWEVYKDVVNAIPKKARPEIKDFPEGLFITEGYCQFGYIGFAHSRKPTEEEKDIVRRFAAEFGSLYQRFLDLQKAEAQAREAQIEVALEKIRSRTMAMQKGEELKDVVVLLYKELIALGVTNFTTCGYVEVNLEIKRQLTYVTDQGGDSLGLFYLPLDGDKVFDERYAAWKNQQAVFHQTVGGKKRREHLEYAITTFNSKEAEEMVLTQFPDPTVFYCFNFSHGYLHIVGGSRLTTDEETLMARFTRVFEQTYARFLDLKKAEHQTREAQINLAVERVRAKALAMHKSEEIMGVVSKLKDEVMALEIPDVVAATIFLNEGDDQVRMWDLSSLEDDDNYSEVPFDITFKLKKSDPHLYVKRVWENPENYFVEIQYKKDFKRLMVWLREQQKNEIADEVEEFIEKTKLERLHHAVKKLNNGKLVIDLLSPPSNEMEPILTKMGAAFDLAYKRFEDLKNAEAQTREAQIEMTLEKVRSRSMAMHKTEDFKDVIQVVYEQLLELNFPADSASFALDFNNTNDFNLWSATPQQAYPVLMYIPYLDIPIYNDAKDAREKELDFYSASYSFEEKKAFFQHVFSHISIIPKDRQQYLLNTPSYSVSCAIMNSISLSVVNYNGNVFSDAQNTILKRFAKVFEQAYTRFLDLQKAEAQTREAKIEAALEKVRSRTMAMQKSEELPLAANNLFLQVQELGIPAWSAGYCIWQDDKHNANCNMSSEGEIQKAFILPSIGEGYDFYTPHKKGERFHVKELGGEALVKHYEFMTQLPNMGEILKELIDAGLELPTFQIFHICYFKHGYVMFITYEEVPEAHDIFQRFSKVFEQTYTRFIDLKQAEARARESQIQSALERVRSHSMGMQSTADFANVTTEMFNQLRNFGEDLFATGIVFCDKHKGHVEQWHSIPGAGMLSPMIVPIDLDYIHQYRYDQWKAGSTLFSIEIPSDFIEQHFEEIFKLPSARVTLKELESRNAPMPAPPEWEIDYGASFKHGYILASSLKPLENMDILPRFAQVFEQAYIRFLDLQKAEAQARESQIEAALEKVRSRTLAMQKSDELADTSVVVFKELLELGIEPNRLFIGIVKDNGDAIEAWATNEDGSKIEQHFKLHTSKNKSIKKMVDGWKRQKKSAVIDMKGKELQEYFHYLNEVMHIPFIDGLKQKRRVQTIAYFSGGLIGMAAPAEQPEETINLLERFAAVFNLTYTRFNDLKIAEAQAIQAEEDLINLQKAKRYAEEALSELQLTQTQLIQSEKMASLGELTAGIAHEIQNPLNFVNNFSEVSKELLDEMLEEMENGDMEEVKAIMDDVIQNLEKINHHGKRADGIVKGMLQHSRAGGDKKEATNINALADEYLRLAYHGLRAKDKSFNAELVTDFDESIESVNVIPQDIGRVILNLLTNAFYVVNEKSKLNIPKYKPTVKISTKIKAKVLEITVTDNGSGMPDSVKEKIFQPFFTTKPTGQGTGLGLSMSYDIITKGHGGELKVETKEGDGTTFKIEIPI